jgi:hypothetical protein
VDVLGVYAEREDEVLVLAVGLFGGLLTTGFPCLAQAGQTNNSAPSIFIVIGLEYISLPHISHVDKFVHHRKLNLN